ncbi:MAG: TetR/AcrR family transcriptional regulator [Fimbriimonadaceae bacterium]|nr:TetR/AcrR family transcriptional regulator [Alphaproteobacteria bacterium]
MAISDGVESLVTDPKLVSERRSQIVQAAVKLFSEQGYYRTTVQQITRKAGVSTGLIYQYFGDKEDILFLSLKLVLETYERDIPPKLEGLEHPLERLFAALRAYCGVVDGLREATILAYRATRALPVKRRAHIEEAETRTNKIFRDILEECHDQGLIESNDFNLLTYQLVHFSHAWALKHWAFRDTYNLESYVIAGSKLLIEPFLSAKGRRYWKKYTATG